MSSPGIGLEIWATARDGVMTSQAERDDVIMDNLAADSITMVLGIMGNHSILATLAVPAFSLKNTFIHDKLAFLGGQNTETTLNSTLLI